MGKLLACRRLLGYCAVWRHCDQMDGSNIGRRGLDTGHVL